ncbi:MAG TPA: DUF6445 family protein [Rhodanobacteraceae bacterium]|nr:DUF6445 family protein [Rhodanobacteraceae bacterium]
MLIERHADIRIEKRILGDEGAVLLVIDNLVADPERLSQRAARRPFNIRSEHFPGVRARAPAMYEHFLESVLKPLLPEHFGIQPTRFAFPMCHYSLVATPPEELRFLQRVPHIDSVDGSGLATVHYLFHGSWGGTAFYRHRDTGFEYVDKARWKTYFRRLEAESRGSEALAPGYINGTTALFEQVARVDAVFNRMLVYRRNSLHSACIDDGHVPPPDPQGGRLSINTFIDVMP